MKRTLWISLAVTLGVLSTVVSYRVSKARAQGGEWTPFTAAMVERTYQEPGVGCATCGAPTAGPRILNYVHATRRDGSWVRDMKRQIMPDRGWGDMRVVMDYSAGARTSVDPSTESLTTYPYPRDVIAKLSTTPQACSTDPGAKHATFLGYDTVVVERTLRGSGDGDPGKITEWRAPELNCFALKHTLERELPGLRVRVEREALLVKEGDPFPDLFEIPAGYVQRSPSEVMAERGRRFPAEGLAAAPASDFETLDHTYRAAQKAR